jgi:hypothetical protein
MLRLEPVLGIEADEPCHDNGRTTLTIRPDSVTPAVPLATIVDVLDEHQTTQQSPKLPELEAARAGVRLSLEIAIEAHIASEDMPDVELLLDSQNAFQPEHCSYPCLTCSADWRLRPDRSHLEQAAHRASPSGLSTREC